MFRVLLKLYKNHGPNPNVFLNIYIFCKYCCFSGCTSCPLVLEVTHTIHPPPHDTDGWPQGRRRSDTAPFPMDTHKQSVGRLSVSQPRPGQGAPAGLWPSRLQTLYFSSHALLHPDALKNTVRLQTCAVKRRVDATAGTGQLYLLLTVL